jgi:hypothetical protein
MRNIGLVSAAVIAMAAMAGTVAAAAPPVMQSRSPIDRERLSRLGVALAVAYLEDAIRRFVSNAEGAGQSGEPAQQSIKRDLQGFLGDQLMDQMKDRCLSPRLTNDECRNSVGYEELSPALVSIAIDAARQNLINNNQLRRGSDGDLAVSAMLAERDPRSGANRPGNNWRWGIGDGPPPPPRVPPTAGDAGRNVPGNEAAGQPATDAGTTEIQQTQTTNDPDLDDGYDPDLDDEAGEPD